MRPKQKAWEHIGDVLTKVRSRKLGKMKQYDLWLHWEEIVGPAVAKHAQPECWRNKTLVVKATNHAWIQELQFLRVEIMDKIRTLLPQTNIKDIRFELTNSENSE